MVARGLRFISIAIVVVAIGAIISSIRLDVSRTVLEQDYGGSSPAYLALPTGARVHYRDEGNPDGAPVILLHSAGSSLHEWNGWVETLGDHFRFIRIDLPGHGLTGRVPGDDYSRSAMAALVLNVADGLDLDRFAVAGADMGGGVAWELARRRGSRLTHLILVAPTGVGPAPDSQPLAVTVAQNPLTRPLLRWVAPRWTVANRLYESFVDDNFVSQAMIDRRWRLARLAGNRSATARRLGLPTPPGIGEYDGAIDVPTVILWGEEDQILPLDRERVEWDLRTKFVGGPLENPLYTFAGVGHMPQIEQAQLSALFAANFIETHPARNGAAESTE